MALTAGDKLGPYEILGLIGAGGMGEVYRARDTKLKRDVALKVLPEAFASDPNRMMRFQREAEVLASLNHPNIAHIYGLEDRALVMELVEGESPKGPLPFESAWKVALQIADALEYAHEKGVIHRDLKPANVKVTPDGVVKLLDFGLAKAFSGTPEAAGSDPSKSPTITLGATVAGTILGTAAYMSPEQARGKNVDKRADIWSWGIVLYELLTGDQLFQGEDAAETLAAVIHKQPDLERVPPQVKKLLRRCLEKDPKKRLRDIGDVRDLLAEEPAPPVAAPFRARKAPWLWPAVAALFVVASAALGWIAWSATRPVEHPLVRLNVDLGPSISLPTPNDNSNPTSAVILSPDGTRLAYVAAASGGATRLFTRRLDQPDATELPGTDGAFSPFFSPDGQWIGFVTSGKVNKISVEGGAVVPLASIGLFGGASWGEDGGIIASEPIGRGLLRIPSGGGDATVVTPQGNGEFALVHPQVLPGAKAILFSAYRTPNPDQTTIVVYTFADHRRKVVARGGVSADYLPTSAHIGHLVYTNKSTLFAVPFDLDRLETRGTAVPVLDDVAYAAATSGGAQFAFSPSGALLYRKGGVAGSGTTTLEWVDGAGKREPLRAKPGSYAGPRVSPHDGKRVAMQVTEGSNSDIQVYEPQRDAVTRVTFGGATYRNSAWSPDGQFVVFYSVGNGIFWARSDGAGQPQPLLAGQEPMIPWSFTGDGKRVAYFQIAGLPQIWTVPVEEDGGKLKAGKPEQFLKSQFADTQPALSPDDHWLAYESNSSGNNEVYVRAFPDNGGQWRISNSGGTSPVWSRASHELLYQSGDQIMAATYTVKGDTFIPDPPHVWLAKLGGTDWDLAPDGKHLVVATPVQKQQSEAPQQDHTVVFLQNFFDYLRQRVPLDK